MTAHPLDVLSSDEIVAAADLLRAEGHLEDATFVARIVLDEPTKNELAAFDAGAVCERRARATLVPGVEATVVEALLSLSGKAVLSVETVVGQRPALLFEESLYAIV